MSTAAAPIPEPPPTPEKRNPIVEMLASFAAVSRLGQLFWVCNLVYMLDGAAYFGILNILTLYLGKSVHLTDETNGLLVSYMTGMLTLFSAVFGGLSDRLGVKRTMTLTILAGLVGRSVLLGASHVPLWGTMGGGHLAAGGTAVVGLTLMAFSAGVLQPACYAGVKQAATKETSAIAFSLLYALMNGGSMLESFVSPFVRARSGPAGVLTLCAGLTVTYLLLHLTLFPRKQGAAPVAAPVVSGEKKRYFDKGLLEPRFLFFIFVLIGVRTLFAHQWLTMPDYVTRAYPKDIGDKFEWWINLNPIIILVGTPVLAALTRRVHVVNMMIAGTLVSACATVFLIPGPSFWAFIAYEVIFSLGEALWSSRFLEYVADIAPEGKVGAYMGFAQLPWFLAKFTTGFYSGHMLATFCPPVGQGAQHTGTMWAIYLVIGLTSPLGLFLARNWLKAGQLGGEARAAHDAAA